MIVHPSIYPFSCLKFFGGPTIDTALHHDRGVYSICARVMPEGSLSDSYYHGQPELCKLLLKTLSSRDRFLSHPNFCVCNSAQLEVYCGSRDGDCSTASSESQDLCRENWFDFLCCDTPFGPPLIWLNISKLNRPANKLSLQIYIVCIIVPPKTRIRIFRLWSLRNKLISEVQLYIRSCQSCCPLFVQIKLNVGYFMY